MMTVVETRSSKKTHSITRVSIVQHSEIPVPVFPVFICEPTGRCHLQDVKDTGGSVQTEWLNPHHDQSSFRSEAAHWMLGLSCGDEAHQSGVYIGEKTVRGWLGLYLPVCGERCMWLHASGSLEAVLTPTGRVCLCGVRTWGRLWRVCLTDTVTSVQNSMFPVTGQHVLLMNSVLPFIWELQHFNASFSFTLCPNVSSYMIILPSNEYLDQVKTFYFSFCISVLLLQNGCISSIQSGLTGHSWLKKL